VRYSCHTGRTKEGRELCHKTGCPPRLGLGYQTTEVTNYHPDSDVSLDSANLVRLPFLLLIETKRAVDFATSPMLLLHGLSNRHRFGQTGACPNLCKTLAILHRDFEALVTSDIQVLPR
jgi:hypothetical protein